MSGNGTAETSEKTNETAAPGDTACRMQRCPEYHGKQRLSNFTKPEPRSTGAAGGERALDKALAEFRPVREEKMRRTGEDFRAKGERRSTENGRGADAGERGCACAAKKSTSAPRQKHDPNLPRSNISG